MLVSVNKDAYYEHAANAGKKTQYESYLYKNGFEARADLKISEFLSRSGLKVTAGGHVAYESDREIIFKSKT